MSSFGLPHSSFFDIAWDHRNQLIWMGATSGTVYGYSIDGSVVATFTSPDTYPYGMAYSSQYLWVACAGNGYVYRVHCPATVSISPSSFGSIKAIYR
jgi:sugar lactone lactonase YvrE